MDIPEELIQAKALVEFGLLALPGVVGVGLGLREENGEFFDELAVRILVKDASQVPDGLPDEIAGVQVCIIERVYEPLALPDAARYPELRGGIRIESPARGFGTMGALVMDAATGEILGLSNFHVTDTVGTQIWQPKTPNLIVGIPPPLDDFVGDVVRVAFPDTPPLPFSTIRVGLSDGGVFRTNGAAAQQRGVSRAIANQGLGFPDLIPAVTATAKPTLFQAVRKRGFTTGLTSGGIWGAQVVGKWLTVNWPTGGPNTYLMEQVEIFGNGGVFAEPGDSGSLVIDGAEPIALGLLWGADQARGFAPAGHFASMSLIANVEANLGISVVWA